MEIKINMVLRFVFLIMILVPFLFHALKARVKHTREPNHVAPSNACMHVPSIKIM